MVLESRRAMLVYSRARALDWRTNDQDVVLQAIDTVIDAEDAISGLDASSELHRPVHGQALMVEVPGEKMPLGAGAYATNFYTGYSQATRTDEPAFTPKLISHGWGTYHELGHLHQQFWTWRAIGEVNVNVYSLAAQRAIRGSALQITTLEKDAERQSRAMQFVESKDPEKYYNDKALGVFPRLHLFRQLWLAYGDAFYVALHRRVREEKPVFTDVDDRMAYFMLKACMVSGHDLSAFFRAWGFKLDSDVYAQMAALRLPPPPVDPSTLTVQ